MNNHIDKVIYAEMAALRFPNYSIEGTGNIAVVLECNRRVVLCVLEMEAQTLVADSCGKHCANGEHRWHRIERLDLPRPEDIRTWPEPHWNRLRDTGE